MEKDQVQWANHWKDFFDAENDWYRNCLQYFDVSLTTRRHFKRENDRHA